MRRLLIFQEVNVVRNVQLFEVIGITRVIVCYYFILELFYMYIGCFFRGFLKKVFCILFFLQ